MFKNVDLVNPLIQRQLREMTVSLNSIAQVRQLGLSAFNRASAVDVPTLVIQGNQDQVVRPVRTARLLNRFPYRVQYKDVDAAHDLVDPDCRAWNEVKNSLLIFADSVRQSPPATNRDSFASESVANGKTC